MEHNVQLSLIANMIFGVTVILVVIRPLVARTFFVLSFLGAAVYNVVQVISMSEGTPSSGMSMLPLFRNALPGFSLHQLNTVILCIAAIQFLIALLLILKNRWAIAAMLLGALYGIFISSLGGYEFPAALLMSIAFLLLAGNYKHDYLWKRHQYDLDQSNTPHHPHLSR